MDKPVNIPAKFQKDQKIMMKYSMDAENTKKIYYILN